MRPIVHAGFHKTASSWFRGRVYPHVASHRLLPGRLVRETLLGGDAFDFNPAAARRALGIDADGRPALLCEEDLSGVLHMGVVSTHLAAAIARRVHATLPDAMIVLVVRSQTSAALSWYQQYLREGGTASRHRYLFAERHRHLGHARPFKVPRFDFAQLDYRGLIACYDDLFGQDRVIVMPYERIARDRAAALAELGARLGVDLPDPGAARLNDSYRAGLVPLLRAANLLTARAVVDKRTLIHLPYWYAIRKLSFKTLNRSVIFGSQSRPLDPGTSAWIAQRFWQSNHWLAERTGHDLRALGYPVDPPATVVPMPGRRLPLAWMRN